MQTILVIEDEPQSRTIFSDCLNLEGFQVISASNGLEGVEQAQKFLPDLILCDIAMPDLDGYGVLTQLRQQISTSLIPFIFLTAKADKSDIRFGMNCGADDYLTKPCTPSDLLAAIASRLQKYEQLKQCHATSEFQTTQACDVASECHATQAIAPVATLETTGRNLGSDATTQPFQETFSLPDCPQLESVFAFLEAHYHESICLKDIAAAVSYSPAYLTTLVRRLTGQTLHDWLVQRRMVAARYLLLTTKLSCSQIATSVGYSDAGHFIRQFRQLNGMPPQFWRSQYHYAN